MTTLLRDAAGVAVPDVDLTLVVQRPDGVEYRRTVVPDQGLGGRSLDVADHLLGADRHVADRGLFRPETAPRSARRASWSRTMCRIGSSSISPPRQPPSRPTHPRKSISTAASSMARRPRASTSRARSISSRRPSVPAIAGYVFGLNATDEAEQDEAATEAIPLADLPQTDDQGKATFTVDLGKLPAIDQAARSQYRPYGSPSQAAGRSSGSSLFRSCRQPP